MLPTARLAVFAICSGCAVAGLPSSVPNGGAPDAGASDGVASADAPPDTPSGACSAAMTGVLATWTFASEPGSQASTAASMSTPGVTAGSLRRASALSTATGASSMNASNWAISSQLDASKYYSLTLAPASGCGLDVTSVALDVKASSTGPATGAIASSADAYAQTAQVQTSAPSTPALAISGASGQVELRVYGFGATSAAGTMRLQNTLTVTGALH